ncbi:MAG TPA: DUF2206 domain-containing protein, partial [Acidimicrobiales bacterium]|nr:DUF2206 domain-containing protein [Acidimicrobiales bacterium]
RGLANVDVEPSAVNSIMRELAAKGEQVFLILGILTLFFSKRRQGTVAREYYYLCIASIVVLVAVTVLPQLSVDYDVERVFQQALILTAPVIVLGSMTLFGVLGAWWGRVATAAVPLVIFASTTGLIPQILGGYPAQLNLNNSGQYYDLYYMTPQEVAAVAWLSRQPDTLPAEVQVDYTSDRFAFTTPSSVSGTQYLLDMYPTLLEPSSWVIADTSMLETGTAAASVDGNLVGYRYPFALLEHEKNLVFTNGGTQIYQ